MERDGTSHGAIGWLSFCSLASGAIQADLCEGGDRHVGALSKRLVGRTLFVSGVVQALKASRNPSYYVSIDAKRTEIEVDGECVCILQAVLASLCGDAGLWADVKVGDLVSMAAEFADPNISIWKEEPIELVNYGDKCSLRYGLLNARLIGPPPEASEG